MRNALARLLVLPGLLLIGAPEPAQAEEAPPPVADFFREPSFAGAALSPDGKKVAMVVFGNDKRGQLAVFDIDKPRSAKLLAGVDKVDVNEVLWVNDQRLVFNVIDRAKLLDHAIWPGLWAVDADGENLRQLIYVDDDEIITVGTRLKARILQWNWRLHSALRDGSDDVLIQRQLFDNQGEPTDTGLARLNTRDAHLQALVKNAPSSVIYWWTDRKGTPVAAITLRKSLSTFYLAQPDGSWTQAFETDGWTDSVPVPLAMDAQGELWMEGADPEHKTDQSVLLRYKIRDPKARPQVVMHLKGYDFDGGLVIERETDEVLGVNFEADAPGSHWFNARMRAIQADIDAQLQGTINSITCSTCLTAENLLVFARSDRQPAMLMRYEVATKKITPLLGSRAWIKPGQMGSREPFSFKARDGLPIPVMVTFPPGPRMAGRPAVVLVHGGPNLRGTHWEWDADAQFLATRGYVVIEPEYRGSTGYGYGLFSAGFKQWGLKMQDDIADAGDWAAKQGFIDPKRVCIAGASYGGYAALMGLARYGDRYRCGIEWLGVTDLKLMFTSRESDASEVSRQYGMPKLVGDPVKDAQQLHDTSPVNLAAHIGKPLLMAHGGADVRVPLEHADAMRDALKAAGNKDLEWVLYPEEGHGWTRLADNVDFWTRVEKFLARHIGAPQ